MSETCQHRPQLSCLEFMKQYFKKEGILMNTFRCKACGQDIRFVKKPAYRVWDVLIWVLLLAFMVFVRLLRDSVTSSMALWVYIVIAVAAVALIGLVLDMAKEWFLVKLGKFDIVREEPQTEPSPEKPAE